MPTYTFRLLDDSVGVADDLGLGLPDTKAAYSYARDVALELMVIAKRPLGRARQRRQLAQQVKRDVVRPSDR